MPYVTRDNEGHINAIFNKPVSGAEEHLSARDPELVNFISGDEETDDSEMAITELHDLRISDLGMIRVLEDLIETLIEKDVIMVRDLPKMAIQRLKTRRKMRRKLQPYSHVLSEDPDRNVLNPSTWIEDKESSK